MAEDCLEVFLIISKEEEDHVVCVVCVVVVVEVVYIVITDC